MVNFGEDLEASAKQIARELDSTALRGDERINVTESFGEDYLRRVGGRKVIAESNGISFEEYIRRCGINPEWIDRGDTVLDLKIRLDFIARIEHICRYLVTDFETAKETILPTSIPSWLAESTLRKFRQLRPRHEGSEINDHHLAALSIYCDLTYVDKRTAEDMKRAFFKNEEFRELSNKINKVTSLDRMLAQFE